MVDEDLAAKNELDDPNWSSHRARCQRPPLRQPLETLVNFIARPAFLLSLSLHPCYRSAAPGFANRTVTGVKCYGQGPSVRSWRFVSGSELELNDGLAGWGSLYASSPTGDGSAGFVYWPRRTLL